MLPSIVTDDLNRTLLVNVSPFSLINVHIMFMSSNVIDGLIVFSRAKQISTGSVTIIRRIEYLIAKKYYVI